MARDFDGSTDHLDMNPPFDSTGSAITISMWIYFDAIGGEAQKILGSFGEDGGGWGSLWINEDLGAPSHPGAIRFVRYGDTPKTRESNDNTVATGSWIHLLVTDTATFTTGTDIHIYKDGSEVAYQATQNGAGSEEDHNNTWCLGGRTGGDDRNVNARICEVGVWNLVQSAGVIAALANRYSPAFFLNGLQSYRNLVRDLVDRKSGLTTTADGTAVIMHPPIIYPAMPQIITAPPALAEYSLACEGGSLSLGGQTVGPLKSSVIVPDAGSLTLSGQVAGTLKSSRIPIDAGSYALAGKIVGLLKSAKLTAAPGTYSLAGLDVTLDYTPVAPGEGIYRPIYRPRRR